MNIVKNTIIILGFLAMFSVVPVKAFPQYEDLGRRCEHRQASFSDVIQKLKLTDKQKEQLRQIRYEHRQQMMEIQYKLNSKRMELRHELEKKDIDREKIDSLISEINAFQGKLLTQMVKNILKMKEILTPEQFEKLHSIDTIYSRKGLGRWFSKGWSKGRWRKFFW